jgi:hypothetical protein
VVEGDNAEIASGLAPGDVVVMTGVDKLQEGTQVSVQMADGGDGRSGVSSGGKKK